MTERVERLTMSVSEAAAELGISTKTAYNLIHVDGFPVIRIGSRADQPGGPAGVGAGQ